MAARKSKKYIIPSRLSFLRKNINLSQQQLVDLITDYSDGQYRVSVAQISSWETGERSVPEKYIPIFCQIYNVNEDYFLGESDGSKDEHNSICIESQESNKILINYEHIYMFDKRPVYVVFLDYLHENGWGIYDMKKNQIQFADYSYKIYAHNIENLAFYALQPGYIVSEPAKTKAMDIVSLLSRSWVWIEMGSPDVAIHKLYDGWYHHNEQMSALINESGLVLPYSGLNKSYKAYFLAE